MNLDPNQLLAKVTFLQTQINLRWPQYDIKRSQNHLFVLFTSSRYISLNIASAITSKGDSTHVVLAVKNLPVNAGGVRDATLAEGMALHSSILAWRIPWTEESGELYSPWGHKQSDASKHITLSLILGNACPHTHMKADLMYFCAKIVN